MGICGGRPPAARQGCRERLRFRVLVLEPHDRRFVVPAVVDAVEMPIEEPGDLVQLIEIRPGRRRVGPRVHPVSDQRVRGRRAEGLHPESRVDVRIMPPADVEDRRLDRVVGRSEGALSPVRSVDLVPQPGEQPRRRRVEPGTPLVAPGRAAVRRIRGHRIHRDLADRVLRQLADGHAPAAVMDVVEIAVVGRHDRHDRAQVGRPERRDLDRREPAIRDAPHPDRAAAPRLGRQPFHRVEPVPRLVGGVFVERDTGR